MTFRNVDRSNEPRRLINYLDAVRSGRAIAEVKARSIEALGLEVGDRALDVGCGTGEEVAKMAELVGLSGHVFGIDVSQTMIDEAIARHSTISNTSFQIGDAQSLSFDDEMFVGVRVERTLQHLDSPDQAVAEIARVLKAGGRAAIVEPDWESMVIAGADVDVSRVIWLNSLRYRTQTRVGRRLRGLLVANGFAEVMVTGTAAILDSLETAKVSFGLERAANRAVGDGVIDDETRQRWILDLERADARGEFFSAVTNFSATGKKVR